MKRVLEFPAVVYMAAFKSTFKKDNTPLNQGCAIINFGMLNFWIVYFAFKPFTDWDLPIEVWVFIGLSSALLLIITLLVNTIETRRYLRELREKSIELNKKLEEFKNKG